MYFNFYIAFLKNMCYNGIEIKFGGSNAGKYNKP